LNFGLGSYGGWHAIGVVCLKFASAKQCLWF
jgi:hypothetical protein